MILDEIVANKRIEVKETRRSVPMATISDMAIGSRAAKDFAASLRGDSIRIVAEIKKASPSKGTIASEFDPCKIARIYARAGAAAISVLTESKYFLGSLDVLDNVGMALGDTRPPLLRKDFIFDAYQVYEARAHGADAILLIVAILEREQLAELQRLARRLGMECLVEVHNEAELEIALRCDARVIGINNRDLKTFAVDLTTTARLKPHIPSDRIVVSESGIKTRDDMKKLRSWGVDAVLIGEALMSSPDISTKMRELL
jgi:indole-3-glycerol phosphate synthase